MLPHGAARSTPAEPASDTEDPPGGAPVAHRVVVADDDGPTRNLVGGFLRAAGFTVDAVVDGREVIDIAKSQASALDAIVLDVMMPRLDGFGVLAALSADPATAMIPVIVLTAHANDEEQIVRALELGAADHMTKPFRGSVLVARVRALCTRRRADRGLRAELAEAEVAATTDALTLLSNRREFERQLGREIAFTNRHRQPFALLILDLDRFKVINDTFGHGEGDRVLSHVARTLSETIRKGDQAFRIGGEEFAVILRACDIDQAVIAAGRLRAALAKAPFAFPSGECRPLTFSVGAAAADAASGFLVDRLVERADRALYRAKGSGRDRVERSEEV